MRSIVLGSLTALLALTIGGLASADPVLTWSETYLGGGLVAYDVFVDAQDGQQLSFYIDVEFSAPAGSSINHSQFNGTEVDYDENAILLDGIGGYDMAVDSFFMSSTWVPGPPLDGVSQTATTFAFSGGTGGGSQWEVVSLAQIVGAGPINFDATISRTGENFYHSGALPEPTTGVLMGLGLVGLAIANRRQRH